MLSPTAWKILECFCTGTLRNFDCYVYRNLPEPHPLSAPQPSGTSSAFCTGTLRNFISFLHQHPPEPCLLSAQEPSEPCLLSAPKPSGTSSASAICTGTRRNLISFLHGTLRNLIIFLHRNPPEPCLLSTPEPSGTSSAICTPPEPSTTFRNLLRNLGLQLHRIAPELFWAKDPIASFAVGEKTLPQKAVSCRRSWPPSSPEPLQKSSAARTQAEIAEGSMKFFLKTQKWKWLAI